MGLGGGGRQGAGRGMTKLMKGIKRYKFAVVKKEGKLFFSTNKESS